MTDVLFTVFIGSNIFPITVIILSFIGYGVFQLYKQMKLEIKESQNKGK